MAQEVSGNAPGASMMTHHLGHMMLMQVVRIDLEACDDHPAGRLFGLSDPRMNRAIEAIHASPAQRWRVDSLAAVAGVSRSTFALHFKQQVGYGPLEYVLRWRMQLATRDVKNGGRSISSIGQALGYDSDSAFSNAFKRIIGCLPR